MTATEPWLSPEGEWLRDPHDLLTETRNAWLMGTAPELLEACKAWMEFNRETKDENPCPDYGLRARLRQRAKELATAAIAKAEGRL